MKLYELLLALSCSGTAYYFIWKSYRPSKLDIAWDQSQCDRGHHIWKKVDWIVSGKKRMMHRSCKHCSLEMVLDEDEWTIFTKDADWNG